MAFAVICKSCQARFLLNDDLLKRKVAGKVVTVRCRQCHAPIEVDASAIDPEQVADDKKPEPPGPPPPPPLKAALAYKPAPAPPRPVKSSTLMGIGAPARPGAAPEMVALSPGLLNVKAPAPTPAGPRGFPEPPPPPRAKAPSISDDWDIPEPQTPLMAKVEAAPESMDDFVEELPQSLPPTEIEELPSSAGTPSLQALAHHDAPPVPKRKPDDFLANMSAALNGGTMPLDMGAPTIDVSALAPAEPLPETSIDLSAFDVPVTGKQTLPLFGMSDDNAPSLSPPTAEKLAAPPVAVDRPASSERPDSVRSRRNVIAPATKSVPPPAPNSGRSKLAVPIVLVLAAAAGFLIWKRGSVPAESVAAQEPPAEVPTAPPAAHPPEPVAATPEPVAVAAATTVTPPTDEDVTITTAKPQAVAKSDAALPKSNAPSSTTTEAPVEPKPKAEVAVEPKPEPVTPKPEPKPEAPSEPAGPFDRAAAAAALTSAAGTASTCRKDGDPSGTASVVITFAPSGRVTSANISGPPFAGTPTGGCIAAALRRAKVPPFEGDRVTVSKTIVVQ
jgi:hypothetical protein